MTSGKARTTEGLGAVKHARRQILHHRSTKIKSTSPKSFLTTWAMSPTHRCPRVPQVPEFWFPESPWPTSTTIRRRRAGHLGLESRHLNYAAGHSDHSLASPPRWNPPPAVSYGQSKAQSQPASKLPACAPESRRGEKRKKRGPLG
jgi:hypothetical protein